MDFDLLKNKIETSGLKIKAIAERLNISYHALKKKLDNKTKFNVEEVKALKNILNLSDSDFKEIFFND